MEVRMKNDARATHAPLRLSNLLPWVLACALAPLAVLGCGDDNGGGGGGGHPCYDLCQAQDDEGCLISSVSDCRDFCDLYIMFGDPGCEPAMRDWNECQLENDPCSAAGCEAEQEAFHDACMD
jgi:hypothetical protein